MEHSKNIEEQTLYHCMDMIGQSGHIILASNWTFIIMGPIDYHYMAVQIMIKPQQCFTPGSKQSVSQACLGRRSPDVKSARIREQCETRLIRPYDSLSLFHSPDFMTLAPRSPLTGICITDE